MSTFSKVDEYGFERPEDFDYKSYDLFMADYMRILARRGLRWKQFTEATKLKKSSRLKRFVRKGIPMDQRGRVWMITSGAKDLKSSQPSLYQELLADNNADTWDETIRNDLYRTFPDNIYFTQSSDGKLGSLYNVLRAFARNTPDVGYCQGLNYIAGLLLLATNDEEKSFWLLTVLVHKILPDYYTKDMRGVIIDIDVLAELVRRKSVHVHNLMNRFNLPWPVVATKWFICLYAEVLPVETVYRIWDCLFYEGPKILFRVGVTLVKLHEEELKKCTDFGELAECFKSITRSPLVVNCHSFMAATFKLPGNLPMSTVNSLRSRLRKT